jgi:hypothetical protein
MCALRRDSCVDLSRASRVVISAEIRGRPVKKRGDLGRGGRDGGAISSLRGE